MNRKQAISHVAGIFGIAISAPVILSGMAGCNETPGRKVAGLFLTEKEWEIVNRVSVILLPGIATIEDGGIQATTFIDKILYYSASTSQQESLRVQLSRFVQECEDSAGIEFMHSSSTKQYQFTKKLFERSFIEKKSDPTAGLPFLLFIK